MKETRRNETIPSTLSGSPALQLPAAFVCSVQQLLWGPVRHWDVFNLLDMKIRAIIYFPVL